MWKGGSMNMSCWVVSGGAGYGVVKGRGELTFAAVVEDGFEHFGALRSKSVKGWIRFWSREICIISVGEGAGAEAGVVEVWGEGCVAGEMITTSSCILVLAATIRRRIMERK
jgi:hypothetical protein